MENEDLFKEGVLNKKTQSKVNFFNLGPENKWQNKLEEGVIKSIETNFFKEMKELSYL